MLAGHARLPLLVLPLGLLVGCSAHTVWTPYPRPQSAVRYSLLSFLTFALVVGQYVNLAEMLCLQCCTGSLSSQHLVLGRYHLALLLQQINQYLALHMR